jgi:hypothetical protein
MEKGQERLDFARLIKRCAVGPRMFCSDAGADHGFQQGYKLQAAIRRQRLKQALLRTLRRRMRAGH